MKSTGIVRQLDNLGRVVLPIELRRTLDIGMKDMLEVFVEGDSIILKKYQPGCVFCGGTEGVSLVLEKPVCSACRERLRQETR